MSRAYAVAATVLAVAVMGSDASAQVWPFGRRDPAPAATPAAALSPEAPAAAAQPLPRATAEERTAAARLDPLAQAAFWGREVERDPTDAEAGLGMARALRAMGQYAEASTAVERVLVVAPTNVEALLESARNKISQGQGFYAVEPLTRAQALQPRDVRAPNLLGVALHQTERRTEAQAAWAQALQLSPENPEVLSNMAMAAAGDGDLAAAEALLRRAVARPGVSVRARQNLVLVLGLRGAVAEAEALARRDLPPEQVANNLAWLRDGAPAQGRSWDAMRSSPPAGG